MSGSVFGTIFRVSTWGESHGKAIGAVIDGCPAGLPLCEADIQPYLDRRKPGSGKYVTQRKEADEVQILSGIFDGKTTGTPISLLVYNTSQRSSDYTEIAQNYRPGAIDIKILTRLGIEVCAYTLSIGPVSIHPDTFDREAITQTATGMPDKKASADAEAFLETCIKNQDSSGGVIECCVTGLPAGIGDPVFDKLDARLASAIMSIGAVKAVEIGDGIEVSSRKGSENNDAFCIKDGQVSKKTNHAGGILGGISDGSPVLLRAHIKPTPSIFQPQQTIGRDHVERTLQIKGRHDPVIVPRAVVVVESMTALTILDLMLSNMGARMDHLEKIYTK